MILQEEGVTVMELWGHVHFATFYLHCLPALVVS